MLLPLLSSEEVSGHHGQRSVVIIGLRHFSCLSSASSTSQISPHGHKEMAAAARNIPPSEPNSQSERRGPYARAFSLASLFYQGEKAFPGIPGQAHAP